MMFTLGFITGFCLTIGAQVFILMRKPRHKPIVTPDKLADARRYLALIATGNTLSFCQKLAVKALEKTA
jgi:hypothetical protein